LDVGSVVAVDLRFAGHERDSNLHTGKKPLTAEFAENGRGVRGEKLTRPSFRAEIAVYISVLGIATGQGCIGPLAG
jgi:hypothetical protein